MLCKDISILLLVTIAFIGIVLSWRGMWNLIDTYFLPNNYLVSNLVSIFLGLLLLLIVIHYKDKYNQNNTQQIKVPI